MATMARDKGLTFSDRQILEEANIALERGGRVATIISGISVAIVLVYMLTGMARGLWIPWGFAVGVTCFSSLLYVLGRKRLLKGGVAWLVMMLCVSLPTVFFVGTHFLLPAGAATFLNGPIAFLYFILIAVVSFLFDSRLSLSVSVVAAAGYIVASALALPSLREITVDDPLLRQNLSSFPIYVFKGMTIIFFGAAMSVLSLVGRRWIRRILREAQEKQMIHRLFGEYVSEEVSERLLRDDGVRAGERKEVVILFSDIREFTSCCEKSPPEELVARLNEYFEEMVTAIREQGGVVDKFIGDAVMAVFGGVLDLDDPGAAAVEAARSMRERLAILNARWARENRPSFDNGIGLHYGEVIQGSIGAERRKDFTVIGDAVNIASRLEGLTRATEQAIVVSDDLYQRLPQTIQSRCVELGSYQLKGRSAPVTIWGVSEEDPDRV